MEPLMLDLQGELRLVPESEPGPGNMPYAQNLIPNWMPLTDNDTKFLENGDASNKDVQVTIGESTKADTTLDQQVPTVVFFFLGVMDKLKDYGCFLWLLPDHIAEQIIRQYLPLFGYHRQQHDLNIITITGLQFFQAEKARAISIIFNRESHARIEVFVVFGEKNGKAFSAFHRNQFQYRVLGPLGVPWHHAHGTDFLTPGNGAPSNRYHRWLQIKEDGVCCFDPIHYDNQEYLFQDVLKWLVMVNGPDINYCTLVICMNHDRLTVTKQDNILNAVSTFLWLWGALGPKRSKVLILKGNVHNPQSTEEALENLITATLSGPDIRLENTGRLRIDYGLRPQEPINPTLRKLVANSHLFEHEGPVSAAVRAWCRARQRPVLWGRNHSTTGQRHGSNYSVTMNQLWNPRGRAVKVECIYQGLGMGANVNRREFIVSARKKTKEEKAEERQKLAQPSNGEEPMED